MTNQPNNLKLTHGDEPHDAELEALLDEALAPEAIEGGVPTDLAARIFDATKGKLQKRRTILGRIGFGSWSAIAASWSIAGLLAVGLSTMAPPAQANPFAVIARDLRTLSDYKGPAESVDQDLASLAVQVDHASIASAASLGGEESDVAVNLAVDTIDDVMIY